MIIPFHSSPKSQREQYINGVGTLFPVFQPIVPLPWTGDTDVIYEVLARVISPDGFVLQPAEFLDRKVPTLIVDQAMLRLIPGIQDGSQGMCLSFNCAPSSLCNNSYFDALRSMVLAHEIDPARLVLEITEDALDAFLDVEMMDRVEILRSNGMRVALDDFGAGGSGIARLAAGHFDILKISPWMDVTSPRGRIIAENLVAMIGNLSSLNEGHMVMVIEGIETKRQLEHANFIGANYAQGSAICQPTDGFVMFDSLLNKVGLDVSESIQYY